MFDDDIPWTSLFSGYRIPFDPRPMLESAKIDDNWDELSENLYHQGDVGTASYASIPVIIEIMATLAQPNYKPYILVCMIEEARFNYLRNSQVPEYLAGSYKASLQKLLDVGLRDLPKAQDDITAQSIISSICHAKNLHEQGTAVLLEKLELKEALFPYLI